MSRRPVKTKFRPRNQNKYAGDVNAIVARSSWERAFFNYLDTSDDVVTWSSEELPIPYVKPNGTRGTYWPDVLVEMKDGTVALIEIKPYNETMPPKKPKVQSVKAMHRYGKRMLTYMKNVAKWEAAKKFCEDNGIKFMVFTENELHEIGIRGVKKK